MVDAIFRRLSEALEQSPAYEALAGGAREVSGLPPPAAALICDLRIEALGRPALAVVPREGDALAWVEALAWRGREASYFPPQGLTPYQHAGLPASVRAREIEALDAWRRHRRVLVVTPRALFRRLPTAAGLERAVLEVGPGLGIEHEPAMAEVATHLSRYGYDRVDLVSEIGEFAVRGGVLDVFGPGMDAPVRLDYFGDTLDSLRTFSVEDQRSGASIERARLLPMSLFPQDESARQRLARTVGHEPVDWERFLSLSEESVPLASWLEGSWLMAYDPDLLRQEIADYARQADADSQREAREQAWAPAPDVLEVPAIEVETVIAAAEVAVETLAQASGISDFKAHSTEIFHSQLARFPTRWPRPRRGESAWCSWRGRDKKGASGGGAKSARLRSTAIT